MSVPVLKFGCFLGPFYLLDMIALNFNFRKGEIQSDPWKSFSLTTEENPPRLTIGQCSMGDLGLYIYRVPREGLSDDPSG